MVLVLQETHLCFLRISSLENIYGIKFALIVIFVEPFFFFWKELIISIILLCLELWDYIEQLHRLVHSLEARVQQTQDNLEQIRNIMSVWSKVALFERSDGKKDTLLCIEDRSEHVQRRYGQQKMGYIYHWMHNYVFDIWTHCSTLYLYQVQGDQHSSHRDPQSCGAKS